MRQVVTKRRRMGRRGRLAVPGAVSMRYKNPTHYFRRTCSAADLTAGNISNSTNITMTNASGYTTLTLAAVAGASWASFAWAFTLADLPDYAEFTSLFDRYKILGVALKVFPGTVSVETAGAAAPALVLHDVVDYDDYTQFAASAAGVKAAQCYESYKCRNIGVSNGKPLRRFIKPRIAVGAYGGGVFTNYASQRDEWIDAASPTVQHYGWKGVIETYNNVATACTVVIKIEATFYLAMKDLR